jgi:hypothetical protein
MRRVTVQDTLKLVFFGLHDRAWLCYALRGVER